MLNEIPKGILMPCPVCGSNNIDWYGYRYISLRCNDCGFEMYPSNDFASENEYFKEWNTLDKIDVSIESLNSQIEFAQKIVDMLHRQKGTLQLDKRKDGTVQEKLSCLML